MRVSPATRAVAKPLDTHVKTVGTTRNGERSHGSQPADQPLGRHNSFQRGTGSEPGVTSKAILTTTHSKRNAAPPTAIHLLALTSAVQIAHPVTDRSQR